jgi:hypothetical protein
MKVEKGVVVAAGGVGSMGRAGAQGNWKTMGTWTVEAMGWPPRLAGWKRQERTALRAASSSEG